MAVEGMFSPRVDLLLVTLSYDTALGVAKMGQTALLFATGFVFCPKKRSKMGLIYLSPESEQIFSAPLRDLVYQFSSTWDTQGWFPSEAFKGIVK